MDRTMRDRARRTGGAAALLAALAAVGTGATAGAATDSPPFNQDGLTATFEVGCFFTTWENGDPIMVPDDSDDGAHPADPANPDDVAYLLANPPWWFAESMTAVGEPDYPFQVAVDVAVGTGEQRLPGNPMPGGAFPEPWGSELVLVLPSAVSHVIREKAYDDGLVGDVTAHAAFTGDAGYSRFTVPIDSDPFPLGTADDPVVPIDGVGPIELATLGLWADIDIPSSWTGTTLDLVFGGANAVQVSVATVQRAEPGTPHYRLNLSCFPNGAGGSTPEWITVGTVIGNHVAQPPSITTATLPDATVGTPYAATVEVEGTSPIELSVTGGALPPGLTLDPVSGLISGAPTAAGSYPVAITAANEAGEVAREYVIVVVPAATPEPSPEPSTDPSGEPTPTPEPTTPSPEPTTTPSAAPTIPSAGATPSPVPTYSTLAWTGGGSPVGGLVAGGVLLAAGTGALVLRRRALV
ncbi:putative Ig domain-containing protein [Salana multivorans]|uniref:Putative Ig domain-containing protein n=1 Tax=Salana multivorans TaxID=120377 RepID=A0A3N2D1J7_9MICO|nr:Ig domain-containing protein [Salana multivorans]ROR93660.1 putative Ig domain-containing protein [Salana multivorans]